jgi:hypothetical protein
VSKWLCALTLAGLCAACGGSESGQPGTEGITEEGTSTSADADKQEKSDLPVYQEVTIPAGTTLRLDLQSAVASDASQVEDTVRASLRQPVTVDGRPVLPSGTEFVGTVTDVARSGRVKGLARVAYRFNSLRYDSERYPITTATIAHQAQPTKKKDATKIGVGAGVGALLAPYSAEAVEPPRARRLVAQPEQARCWRRAETKFGVGQATTSTPG